MLLPLFQLKKILLTCTTESLPPHSGQHGEAEVAVGRLAEVLQPPQVTPILTDILETKREKERR